MGKTAGEHYVENPSDVQGAIVHTKEGTIRERPSKAPRDAFSVSDAKRKEYGIQDHEDCYWARDPKVWAKIEFNDRVDELSADVSDGGANARLVRTPEMDTIHIGNGGDLVLMAVPKEVREQQQAEIDEANRKYQGNMRQTEQGWVDEEKEIGLDRDNLPARMAAEHDWLAMNSPTNGMSYMEAQAYYKRTGFDVEAHQEQLRMGGQHIAQNDDNFKEMITGSKRQNNARRFGMGNTGIGKTTQQRLRERGGGS